MASLLAPPTIFDPPSLAYLLLTQPVKLVLRLLAYALSSLHSHPRPIHPRIRLVCISDTHTLQPSNLPAGDLLIHAGDLTNAGTLAELQAQIDWLDGLPYEHKIVIAGNHDTWLDPRSRKTLDQNANSTPLASTGSNPEKLTIASTTTTTATTHNHASTTTLNWKSITYLQHSSTTLHFPSQANRALKIFGAPQIPACGGPEFAFQYPRGSDAWTQTLPRNIDVLVTHTPPKFHLDLPRALGCEFLLAEVWRVRPRMHVFGHVHAGKTDLVGWLKGGREVVRWDEGQRCLERALGRGDGVLGPLIDLRNWLDGLRMVGAGLMTFLWNRIWGGSGVRPTIMVNAAMVYDNTGKLGHHAQVVDI